MAILHNLSDISDNLSGFDPVAGITSGTVIGRGWLMWKLFTEMANFDANIKMITNSSPTPTFLQPYAGSSAFFTEPAKDRSVSNETIRFYMANDVGLSQSPQNAIIYEWKVHPTSSTNYSICYVKIYHLVNGGTLYQPGGDTDIFGGASGEIYSLYQRTNWSTTTTDFNLIHKVIYWKSSNANAIIAIDKITGAYRGFWMWFNPTFIGYRANIGVITEGLNHRAVISLNAANGNALLEAFTPLYSFVANSIPTYLSTLTSAGRMPSQLLNFNSTNNLIANKIRFAVYTDSTLKSVSDEIEGVRVTNAGQVAVTSGSIVQYNTQYYIKLNGINDGRDTYIVLLQLN